MIVKTMERKKKKKPRWKMQFMKVFSFLTHKLSKGELRNGDWIDGNLLMIHDVDDDDDGWVFPLFLVLVCVSLFLQNFQRMEGLNRKFVKLLQHSLRPTSDEKMRENEGK